MMSRWRQPHDAVVTTAGFGSAANPPLRLGRLAVCQCPRRSRAARPRRGATQIDRPIVARDVVQGGVTVSIVHLRLLSAAMSLAARVAPERGGEHRMSGRALRERAGASHAAARSGQL